MMERGLWKVRERRRALNAMKGAEKKPTGS